MPFKTTRATIIFPEETESRKGSSMPSIDWPLERLLEYKPTLTRAVDFESFWRTTIDAAVAHPMNAEFMAYPFPAPGVEVFTVRFDGFEGGRLAGWFARPAANADSKHPGLCLYHGYSGRGPRPLDFLHLVHAGFCVMSLDCRGQNGLSQNAATFDGGHQQGWMTQGIRDPQHYYYRYVYADAVRALELLASRDEVDDQRLAISGVSQGGGLTLAVAALSNRPQLALPDIPFLCDFPRSIEIANAGPYPEIPLFIKAHPPARETVMRTLSYCDAVNLAPWIKCRTVISNCLWDNICPPSSIFAAYNHMTCEKQMEIYPYHLHEVPYDHNELKYRALMQMCS